VTEEVFRYDAAPDRRRAIVTTVRDQGFVSVTELARLLSVSDMTIRRDLRRLEQEGEVRVVRGGVHLPSDSRQSEGFSGRAGANSGAKEAVAALATGLIDSHDTIALDAGTTACALARALPETYAGSVVTHSVPAIEHLLGQVRTPVVGLGGDLYRPSEAFVGPATVEAASRLRVRTFFLGAAAVDTRGVYVSSDIERPTKQALMDIADRVVLLVDGSKFSTSAPVKLCSLADIDAVVADMRPPADACAALDRAGVDLVTSLPAQSRHRTPAT
jgi:DeoR/GlpR family transcriptional regulator of sugar metabolism